MEPGLETAAGRIPSIGALRIAIDGTPLLGHRTGVGEVTAGLLEALARRSDVSVTTYALTWRGRGALADAVPANVTAATRPIPASVVREFWDRGASRPRAEDWTGPVDVVHATNFVAPPAKAVPSASKSNCRPRWRKSKSKLSKRRSITRAATNHAPRGF